jgi:hypothetical protein
MPKAIDIDVKHADGYSRVLMQSFGRDRFLLVQLHRYQLVGHGYDPAFALVGSGLTNKYYSS